MADLKSKSLAELHELAGEAGIEKFRLLRREELIEKLGDSKDSSDDSGESGGRDGGSSRRRRRGGDRDRDRDRDGDRDRGKGRERRGDRERRSGGDRDEKTDEREDKDSGPEPELTEITGVLDVLPRGSGIIRSEDGPSAGIYVSPAQIRRCELRSGDEVSGPVRPARRGERRPSLVRVELVNGEPPVDERAPRFESLTPVAPHRHMPLSGDGDDILARSVDLLAPLAFGQRVLVEAQPRSGRTSFLRSLAKAIAKGAGDEAEIIVLLIDERPEEVTAWSREVPEVEIAAAPADLGAHEQVRVAERMLAKVKRQAEAGNDVVIIVDSLTRLGNAYGDPGAVKPFFGAGRELEEDGAGSVTVIATALWGAPGDQDVMDAVHTTENATIRLDAGLAAAGVVPSLDVTSCAVSGQEAVLDQAGVDAVRRLRAELKDMEPVPAANRLAELIKGSASNEELLNRL
ncbi:MAG: Rho termination factor N-terminal domain-containing protein [Solirubrobacterales bacterium]|nr:Rho termination factor N-terminal domain-containing protein [Solirubrobacterales bacterium]